MSVDAMAERAIDRVRVDAADKGIDLTFAGERGSRCSATASSSSWRSATWSRTPSPTARTATGSTVAAARATSRWSSSSSPTRASASRPTRSTASSSASTASTRPGPGRPAAPASACRSSSTSPRPTAARCGCGASRARARRSPWRCPPGRRPAAGHRTPARARADGPRGTDVIDRPTDPRRACRQLTAHVHRGGLVTRVLVVEDEESYSDALAYMLRKEGFDVALAATGPACARGVRAQRRRHRAARPDAARAAGHRGVPADPPDLDACR